MDWYKFHRNVYKYIWQLHIYIYIKVILINLLYLKFYER